MHKGFRGQGLKFAGSGLFLVFVYLKLDKSANIVGALFEDTLSKEYNILGVYLNPESKALSPYGFPLAVLWLARKDVI